MSGAVSDPASGLASAQETTGAILADTIALARIPAPAGQEHDRIAWLDRRLRRGPGDLHHDEAGNLHWTFGRPPFELMLLVHVDTVFGADLDHEPSLRDGWLHGPGTGDNTVAITTAVHVTERLAGAIAAPLAVVFTTGEEGLGGLRGARHACATVDARQVIALEGHGLDAVFTEAIGCLRVELTIAGPGGHSWWDRGRPSAAHELVRLLGRLLDAVPAGVAVNVGIVQAGAAVNAIAGHARALVEGRALDEQSLEQLFRLIFELAGQGERPAAAQVLDRRPAGRIGREHPLTAAVLEVRRGLGLGERLADGSTDANAALAAGRPALALGCVRGADMHSPAERIQIASIALGAAQLEGVLARLLAGQAEPMIATTVRDQP
ncbi:MAG TPA: M20/M25/M40 family metallo-hydrolase [Streptosporangiaceae bacterium]